MSTPDTEGVAGVNTDETPTVEQCLYCGRASQTFVGKACTECDLLARALLPDELFYGGKVSRRESPARKGAVFMRWLADAHPIPNWQISVIAISVTVALVRSFL